MKTSLKRTAILILASALMAAFSTSCGTVRGVGQDVGSVGHGIQHAAH